jgi:hypothetical protein
MLKKFKDSSTKTVAEQSMSSQTPLGWISYGVCQEIDLNRKFDHAPHCREICSPPLDKLSKAAARKQSF